MTPEQRQAARASSIIVSRHEAAKRASLCSHVSAEERVKLRVSWFWERVDKSGGCWIWTGSKNACAYGTVGWDGKAMLAHRVSFLLVRGYLPPYLCHNCPGGDNPSCVNPDHLFEGNPLINTRDAISKGTFTRAKGERNGRAKITEDDVRMIRSSGLSTKELVSILPIGRSTIMGIKSGDLWKEVTL